MIHLMLNNLRRPAGEVFCSCLHFQGLILHLEILSQHHSCYSSVSPLDFKNTINFSKYFMRS